LYALEPRRGSLGILYKGSIMDTFRFKEKQSTITLDLIKEQADGTEKKMVLEFDCSSSNWKFIKEVGETIKVLEKSMANMTTENFIAAFEAERKAFEIAAPDKWDEVFAFVGEDVFDMSMLLRLMLKTIKDRGVANRMKQLEAKVETEDGSSV
jgi:hypothetical protein